MGHSRIPLTICFLALSCGRPPTNEPDALVAQCRDTFRRPTDGLIRQCVTGRLMFEQAPSFSRKLARACSFYGVEAPADMGTTLMLSQEA